MLFFVIIANGFFGVFADKTSKAVNIVKVKGERLWVRLRPIK